MILYPKTIVKRNPMEINPIVKALCLLSGQLTKLPNQISVFVISEAIYPIPISVNPKPKPNKYFASIKSILNENDAIIAATPKKRTTPYHLSSLKFRNISIHTILKLIGLYFDDKIDKLNYNQNRLTSKLRY